MKRFKPPFQVFFSDLRRNSYLLPIEEWAQLETKWNKICAYMRDWNALFDKELSEPLASIAEWLATGEKLVHSGLELDGKSDVEAMKYMERTVSHHHQHFKIFPLQRERFYQFAQSKQSQEVRPELIKMLRKRIETLSTEYQIRMQTLLLLQVHYKILVFTEDLEQKLKTWRTAHSLSLLKRWISEYQVSFSVNWGLPNFEFRPKQKHVLVNKARNFCNS